uniref:Actin-like protein N-terminal domain-containing protein n=2 Tax=Gloeothece TaxID=28070 RepID=E0UMP4_GLOV7|nr:conserved hypothetical protein [Gloeothece verrucosa PCC 7822]
MSVPELIVSLDFGASLIKGVYTLGKKFEPKLLTLSPHLLPIPPTTDLEPYNAASLSLTASAWIECKGKRYAVGTLAKNRFNAPVLLELPKIESIIPRTLAAIGCIASAEGLEEFTLSLWISIPSNEYKEGLNISQKIKQSLLDFIFRGKRIVANLMDFSCKPEGAGIFLRIIGQANFNARKAAVLMLGYRNATILFYKEGLIEKITENYGFASIVEGIQSLALLPGDLDEVVGKIFEAGDKLDKKILKTLCFGDSADTSRINAIESAIQKSREEYFTLLNYWLGGKLIDGPEVIVVVGGTSHYPYVKNKLTQLFKKTQIKLDWGEELADKIGFVFKSQVASNPSLKYRLLDVYSLFLEQDTHQRRI